MFLEPEEIGSTSLSAFVTPPSSFIRRKKGSSHQKLLFHNYFLQLSEDLLFGILFSGYLGYSYEDLFAYLFISKQILQIGCKCLGLLEIYNDEMHETNRQLRCLVERKLFHLQNVIYFKINGSYSASLAEAGEKFFKKMIGLVMEWKHSLKGLSFRASMIDDQSVVRLLLSPTAIESMVSCDLSAAFLESAPVTPATGTSVIGDGSVGEGEKENLFSAQPIASPKFSLIPHLMTLDLSKDSKSKSHLITDKSVSALKYYPQLIWLSLAYTEITDQSISLIHRHLKQLHHLNIQGCYGLTNDCGQYLKDMPLRQLDITNCPLLSPDFFITLFGNRREPIFLSLELFACSYMSIFRIREFYMVAACPNLIGLDCRSRRINQDLLPPNDVIEFRKKLKVLIIDHKDQITYLRTSLTMMPTDPNFRSLWPFYGWPYCRYD